MSKIQKAEFDITPLQIARWKPNVKNYYEALKYHANEFLTLGFDVLLT